MWSDMRSCLSVVFVGIIPILFYFIIGFLTRSRRSRPGADARKGCCDSEAPRLHWSYSSAFSNKIVPLSFLRSLSGSHGSLAQVSPHIRNDQYRPAFLFDQKKPASPPEHALTLAVIVNVTIIAPAARGASDHQTLTGLSFRVFKLPG
jgi:hypothetical protein